MSARRRHLSAHGLLQQPLPARAHVNPRMFCDSPHNAPRRVHRSTRFRRCRGRQPSPKSDSHHYAMLPSYHRNDDLHV